LVGFEFFFFHFCFILPDLLISLVEPLVESLAFGVLAGTVPFLEWGIGFFEPPLVVDWALGLCFELFL
jgi:hypothetical protein